MNILPVGAEVFHKETDGQTWRGYNSSLSHFCDSAYQERTVCVGEIPRRDLAL